MKLKVSMVPLSWCKLPVHYSVKVAPNSLPLLPTDSTALHEPKQQGYSWKYSRLCSISQLKAFHPLILNIIEIKNHIYTILWFLSNPCLCSDILCSMVWAPQLPSCFTIECQALGGSLWNYAADKSALNVEFTLAHVVPCHRRTRKNSCTSSTEAWAVGAMRYAYLYAGF